MNGDHVIIDAIDHAELSSPGRMQALEFRSEGLADARQILGQRAQGELQTGCRYGFGQVLSGHAWPAWTR